MSTAYIALGSNLGDREQNIQKALCLLEKKGIDIIKTSTIIETLPVDGPPQNKFLNAVIKIKTSLKPHALLSETQNVENILGRKRTIKNGPRTIDLDILLYDNIKIDSNNLTIPHPRMGERPFVLNPLKEIEPTLLLTKNANENI